MARSEPVTSQCQPRHVCNCDSTVRHRYGGRAVVMTSSRQRAVVSDLCVAGSVKPNHRSSLQCRRVPPRCWEIEYFGYNVCCCVPACSRSGSACLFWLRLLCAVVFYYGLRAHLKNTFSILKGPCRCVWLIICVSVSKC